MILSKKRNLDLINEHLTCRLCSGYLIDAWTINECLHSFCRACIFSYFNDNDENTSCPVCFAIPHPGNPLLGISKDCWLQQLVYKLVPSLFKREMCRRRIFYDAHPESKAQFIEQYNKTHPSHMGCREEELGELSERCLFQQQDKFHKQEKLHITLEHIDQDLKIERKQFHYLECSAQMPIKILKQYLKKVLPLSQRTHYQIEIVFEQKVLLDNFTLNHIYAWKPNKHKQLHLSYRVIILEQDAEETIKQEEFEQKYSPSVKNGFFNLNNSNDNQTDTTTVAKPPAFLRSSNVSTNPNSFVHTTPFTPAEAKMITLNHSILEQIPSNESIELIKPKECTLLDCKTFTNIIPINYSMDSISDMSKPKKRTKKSNTAEQSLNKRCKTEKKKKIKEEVKPIMAPLIPAATPIASFDKSSSENEKPPDIHEQKQLSYSEIIQEANKLLAAEEPLTPVNNPPLPATAVTQATTTPTASLSASNPATARLAKPIATVSPLHTSKTSNHRLQEKPDDDQLIDLSKSNVTLNSSISDIPVKLEPEPTKSTVPEPTTIERKKRSRQISSSTTRTKVSRHSNKSNHDEGNESTKSLKKTLSHMSSNPNPYLPPSTSTPTAHPQQQQQMFQNFFHSFQNQANYWPINPWSVPPSLALMADPRSYYPQAWTPGPSSTPAPSMHAPKDLSSVSLNDFIGEPIPTSVNNHFVLPPGALLNSASNFSRQSSASSLHLHHNPNRHRPTPLNGTLS